MAERSIKIPDENHPISITPNPKRVLVRFGGEVIADSTRALSLKEASYPPVQYVPREDANMNLLERSATQSHCPYKGDASYFSIVAGGHRAADAVWSYETPHAAVAGIKEYLAFYPDRVDGIEERD